MNLDSFDQSSTLENTNRGFNTTQEQSTFDFDGELEVSDFRIYDVISDSMTFVDFCVGFMT